MSHEEKVIPPKANGEAQWLMKHVKEHPVWKYNGARIIMLSNNNYYLTFIYIVPFVYSLVPSKLKWSQEMSGYHAILTSHSSATSFLSCADFIFADIVCVIVYYPISYGHRSKTKILFEGCCVVPDVYHAR